MRKKNGGRHENDDGDGDDGDDDAVQSGVEGRRRQGKAVGRGGGETAVIIIMPF